MSDLLKPLEFVGGSRKDLKNMPNDVRQGVGFALYAAQQGDKSHKAKVMRGFGGAGVLEVVADYNRDTYRAVYTVTFVRAVYVLHCFKKKAKSGIATPRADVELIKERLKRAEEHYRTTHAKKEGYLQ